MEKSTLIKSLNDSIARRYIMARTDWCCMPWLHGRRRKQYSAGGSLMSMHAWHPIELQVEHEVKTKMSYKEIKPAERHATYPKQRQGRKHIRKSMHVS